MPAGDPVQEYRRRFARLEPKDVQGHYALAEWCREHEQYELLLSQAKQVLSLDPDHTNAKLLVTIATQKLEELRADGPGPDQPGDRGRGHAGFVTKKDIQELRFAELQDLPDPDRRLPRDEMEFVRVRFAKDVINDFLGQMSGHPDFSGRANRQEFLTRSPTEQLQLIRRHAGGTYAERIETLSDPLTFRRFKRVLPIILRGCATTGCHAGTNAAKPFKLQTARRNTDLNLYTNYLILDRVAVGRDRLVNRDRPQESLILEYGLPARHARKSHHPEIRPLFSRAQTDPNYAAVLEWIRMLRIPRPRTGVVLEGYPEPPPPGAALSGEGNGGKQPAPVPAPVE